KQPWICPKAGPRAFRSTSFPCWAIWLLPPEVNRPSFQPCPGRLAAIWIHPMPGEGATVYLPIFHDGAYFQFGDAHGLQGDGELTGTGIETALDVTLQFDLIKGKKIEWPRFENQDYIMVAGSARPLEDAFRIANVEMVKWLESDYGFDRWEALEVF